MIIISLALAAVILLWPNSLNAHQIISDNEYRSIVANWGLLSQTELFEIKQRETQIKGLWEQGCLYLDEPYLNLSIVLRQPTKGADDSNVVRKQTIDGRTFQVESDSAMILFHTDRYFDARVFRNRVDQMLMIIHQGPDSQWPLILQSLADKATRNGITQITIKQSMWSEDVYYLQYLEQQHLLTTADDICILPSVPTRDSIGKTREDILNEYGVSFIDIAWDRHYPIYPTKDGYLVIFVTNDATTQVDRIIVLDLSFLNTIDRVIT